MNNFEKWCERNRDEERPVTREVYDKYYNEGRDRFFEILRPDGEAIWYGGGRGDTKYKNNARLDGFREACGPYMEEKYKITRFQKEVRQLIEEYGLKLKFCDEYNSPYAETPEGFYIKLC